MIPLLIPNSDKICDFLTQVYEKRLKRYGEKGVTVGYLAKMLNWKLTYLK